MSDSDTGKKAAAQSAPQPEKTGKAKARKKKKKRPPKGVRIAGFLMGGTVDTVAGTIGAVFKFLGSLLLILMIAGLLFALIFAYYVKTQLTPMITLSLDDYQLAESGTIYYQDHNGYWQEMATLPASQDREWVNYDNIPWYMEKALVAIEDKRFYEHKGVDWYRTSGAFVQLFSDNDSYGGSTITQQLIKNLTGKKEVTVQRKLGEIFSALELEKSYNKEEIIEWYLNAVYFGEGAWGVQTAAHRYFNKDVWDLTLAESAAIVGITNKPTAYDPFFDETANKQRQETILREMYDQGYIDYNTYIDAVNEDISAALVHSENEVYTQEIYTYYEEVVIQDVIRDLMALRGISEETATHLVYNGGYHIYSCIDMDVQAQIDAVYQNVSQIPKPYGSDQQLQSSIVILDPYTGAIKGLSGGVGEKRANFLLNRATGTQRPAGSSIKPIASYGPATELGLITPNTLVNDSPYLYLNGTSWYPQNDGGGNYGVVTILRAITLSLNTVAAQIVDKLPEGPVTSYNFLRERLGVTSLVPDDASYAPMALGQLTNGITVREMAQAYDAFVNDGIFTYARSYSMVTDADGNIIIDNTPKTSVAFTPNTAHVMTYMLQNACHYGTGTEAWIYNMPVAGKTGTTSDYKDRWFVGCTPYYVAAVWTGFDTPERIRISGNPAAQIFRKIMQPLHEGLEWRDFAWPYIGGDTGIFGVVQPTEPPVYTDPYYNGGGQTNDGTVIIG